MVTLNLDIDVPSFGMCDLKSLKKEVSNFAKILILSSFERPKVVEKEEKIDLSTCFHGDWGNGKSVEEYCKELREGLLNPEEIEAW